MHIYLLPIIKEIESASGTNEKIMILEKHKDNVLLRMFFEAACNPYRVYNIKKIPEYKCDNEFDGSSLSVAFKQLQFFENRTYTGANATKRLCDILSMLSEEDANIFARVIKKDPELGIGATTINKVWPNLIPENIYMGATPMSDAALARFDYLEGVYSQVKEDGLFNYGLFDAEGNVNHFGRSGIQYDFQGHFDYLGKTFRGCRVDGEIRVYNEDRTGYLHRKLSNSYVNKFQVGKKPCKEDLNRLCFIVWDVVPLGSALKGHCGLPYSQRFNYLYNAVNMLRKDYAAEFINGNYPEIRLVHTQILHSLADAREMYKQVKAQGEEGLIIKAKSGIWQNGKPWWQVKLKNETEKEMVIVGFVEHKKQKGRLGAFMLASKCGLILTNCGSGLTKEESIDFWERREELMGKIVSMKFESIISKEGRDTLSLNLPIYLENREDKQVADDLASFIAGWENDNGCKVDADIAAFLA